jgi:hypothetical protein
MAAGRITADVAALRIVKGHALYACELIDRLPPHLRILTAPALASLEDAERRLADVLDDLDGRAPS